MSSLQLETRPYRLSIAASGSLWLSSGMVLILAAALYFPFPVNHDAAWIVLGAERLWDGDRFGRDVIDVNPPLAWWLSVPAVLLARIAGLELGLAFQAYVLSIALACLALCLRFLRLSGLKPSAGLAAFFAAVFLLLPAYDFGQREHLMMMLACPYVVMCSLRTPDASPGPATAVAVGLMAGLAFCLKPYFLIIPAGLAMLTLLRTHRLRSVITLANVAMAVVGAVYLAAIYAFAPDYIATIVPEAMIGYGAYANPFLAVTRTYLIWLVPALLAVVAMSHRVIGQTLPLTALYTLFAGLLAAIAAIVQQKGWSYHIMPATGFIVISAAISIAAWTQAHGRKLKPAIAAACVLIALTLIRPVQGHVRDLISAEGNHAVTTALVDRLNAAVGPQSVFAFITSPRNVHPAVLATGADWVAPACCAYLLPAHVRATEAPGGPARREVAERQMAGIVQTLVERQPDIILVDDRPQKLGFAGTAFDYLEWLNGRPGVAGLFATYSEGPRAGHFRVFKLRK